MSYRITARNAIIDKDYNSNDTIYHQVYGNNESPWLLEEYLKSKGVEFDGDGCFKNYEVTDIQELLEVMLKIHNEQIEDDSFWDFKPTAPYKTDTVDGLMSYWWLKLDSARVLVMYNFFDAFRDYIQTYWDDEDNIAKYKLNGKGKIYLSGF